MIKPNSTIAAMSLAQLLQTEPDDSINHMIAQTIVKCMRENRDITTNYLAQSCSVSKTSITRFCRYLGFDSFTDFKELIQVTDSDHHRKYKPDMDSPGSFASDYLEQIIQNCIDMKNSLDIELVFQLAKDIHQHEHICLLGNGQSGNSLNSFMISLLMQGKYAQVASMPAEQESIINNLKPDTLVIVLSIYGEFFKMYVNDSVFATKPANTTIYLLTCNPDIPCPANIDYLLLCSQSPGFAAGNLSADIVLNLVLQYYKIITLC